MGRGSTVTVLLSELEECVSSPRGLEEITDARELGRVLNGWLGSLPRQDCADFMRRYWGGESVADIAASRGVSANALSQKFARMRKSLRSYLEEKGAVL